MGRFQNHWRRDVMFECVFPAGNAYAPFIAWVEAGKTPLRMWRYEVIPVQNGEVEKLARRLNTNRVQAGVFRSGPAISIAKKAGHRITATTLQLGSQHVSRHNRIKARAPRSTTGNFEI